MNITNSFLTHDLGNGGVLLQGQVPESEWLTATFFEDLWRLKPSERPWITIHGRRVQIPRWNQAFARDYRFSGQVSVALAIPCLLDRLTQWVQEQVDSRLNGLLLNWYDSSTNDYIGPHHDKTTGLVPDSPIVTISFGTPRIFRLTRGKTPDREVRDFKATAGTVFVMPWNTNKEWKHEVPHRKGDSGRRVSVTFRAFSSEPKSAR